MKHRHLLLFSAAALCLGSCTTIDVKKSAAPPPRDSKGAFSHDQFDAVLKKVVDIRGKVNYEALRVDHAALDQYLGQLAATSPDNDKSLFPDTAHKMAYWLNAYNALVLKQVIEKGVSDSVGDSIANNAKFFKLTYFEVGGERLNLETIEHDKVADVFGDPRVHFALNCGADGSPRLRADAFRADRLDATLEECAKEFCNDEHNVAVNRANASVSLSKIFDWYGADFAAYAGRKGVANPTVRDCINFWRPADKKLPKSGDDVILDFDWSLNAQKK